MTAMRTVCGVALGVALAAVVVAAPSAVRFRTARALAAPAFSPVGGASARTDVLAAPPRRLASVHWLGGTFPAAGAQSVSVYVSSSYPDADARVSHWADFFASLVHGSELSLMRAYIAPLDEVQEACASDGVLGCYWGDKLYVVGDSWAGIRPEAVAAHEYGHHIAAHRDNAPWPAIDWGTKRWASNAGICGRVAGHTAFPGDEGPNYELNPGEAFAEAYRVLVETNGTAVSDDWPIVSSTFQPDATALAAVREDVLQPWSGPTVTTIRQTFQRRSRTWTAPVATPLDGDVRIRLTVPGGGGDDVALLSDDGRLLARGTWASAGGKSIDYRVCGARSVQVRVTRGSASRRFVLRIAVP